MSNVSDIPIIVDFATNIKGRLGVVNTVVNTVLNTFAYTFVKAIEVTMSAT